MGYRILVVDDSPVLRIMLSEMLQALGHEVVGDAENVADGIKAYRELKPDLVTLDVSLPDGNGIDMLKQLRRIDPKVKALIVTGNDQKSMEARALALNALGVLHKPFDTEELGALIQRVGPQMRPGGK